MIEELQARREPASLQQPREASRVRRWTRFVPYVLALFFALWSLRGVGANNVMNTDGVRHAMNGAFLYDWVRSGHLAHPIDYGKFYYGRLPALSLPYHPPLFPAIESVFFWLLGVNVLGARLAVALSTAICVLLFYRLIVATHGSLLLAVFATTTFFFWEYSQLLAADVMLEFPVLAFILGALYCIHKLFQEDRLAWGLGFALLGSAAVWTKQHAVFLGLVPFFYLAITRRWRVLAGKTIWISSALFAAGVLALTFLSVPFRGSGADQVKFVPKSAKFVLNHVPYYIVHLRLLLGLVPFVGVISAFLISLWESRDGRQAKTALYLAWSIAAFLLLVLLGAYDDRYLFFVYPPLIVMGYAILFRVGARILPAERSWYLPAALAALCIAAGLANPVHFLHGPAEVAAAVVDGSPRRILYCGESDGNFVFSTRALDSSLRTVVILGSKLPASAFTPALMETFAQRYGISYIVVEEAGQAWKWNKMQWRDVPSAVLEREVPMSSSPLPNGESVWSGNHVWKGRLMVYRFTKPSAHPDSMLNIPIPKLGGRVQFQLERGESK
jgi:hypothetical protein